MVCQRIRRSLSPIKACAVGRVFEQRGLPDPRLADERQYATVAVSGLRKQAIEGQPLVFAAKQHQPSLTSPHPECDHARLFPQELGGPLMRLRGRGTVAARNPKEARHANNR